MSDTFMYSLECPGIVLHRGASPGYARQPLALCRSISPVAMWAHTRASHCNKVRKDPRGRGISEWVGMFFYSVVVKHPCIDKSVVAPHLQFWYVDMIAIEYATQRLLLVVTWSHESSSIGSHFFVRLNVVVRLILVCSSGSRDTQEWNAAVLEVQRLPLPEAVATDKAQLEILLGSRSDGPVRVEGHNLWMTKVALVHCFAASRKNVALRWHLMVKCKNCSYPQRSSGNFLADYSREEIPAWLTGAAMCVLLRNAWASVEIRSMLMNREWRPFMLASVMRAVPRVSWESRLWPSVGRERGLAGMKRYLWVVVLVKIGQTCSIYTRRQKLCLVRRCWARDWTGLKCNMRTAMRGGSVVEGRRFEYHTLIVAIAMTFTFDAILAYWSFFATFNAALTAEVPWPLSSLASASLLSSRFPSGAMGADIGLQMSILA
ncbi:hypothetical protein KC342_g29 [Hortaea werneckii]|nr:hypothetical protein KC342_g29 [Hortaea werneckii]